MAITLGVLLAAGVAAVGLFGEYTEQTQREAVQAEQQARRSGPLALPPAPAPQADTPECSTVLAALPPELVLDDERVPRRELAQPAPSATVAWGDAGHDPVTVRCGMADPAELTPTSKLVEVSGVSWLEMSEGDKTTWLAADRPVRVALTLPADAGSGALQDLSKILRDKLPKQDVFP